MQSKYPSNYKYIYKNVSTHTKNKETKLTLHAQSDHTQCMINNSNYHSAEMDIMQLSDQL